MVLFVKYIMLYDTTLIQHSKHTFQHSTLGSDQCIILADFSDNKYFILQDVHFSILSIISNYPFLCYLQK
jgi:hypothetical protein